MSLVELVDPSPADVPPTPEEWLRALRGPAVVRLTGRDRGRCRGVSTLLHGDEPSGLHALHAYVKSGAVPATDVVATIGAVDAALAEPVFSHRFLPTRRDLNRCFPGGDGDVDARLARAIFDALSARTPELVVDLHNTSGKNPCFGVVPALDPPRLRIVALFTTLVMKADRHLGTLNDAFAKTAPSVTVECGQAQDPAAHALAKAGLRALLSLEDATSTPLPDFEVFAGNLRVRFADDANVCFGASATDGQDLTLLPDVDRFNFAVVPKHTVLGFLGAKRAWPFVALDDGGRDVSRELFACDGDLLVTAKELVPALMTTSIRAARADCWTYVVERTVRAT